MITRTSIKQLKAQVDIVDTIRKSVTLERAGSGCYFGRSPFAKNDDDRSLVVSSTYQIYQCLDSGKEGDVFNWLEETEGIGFWQAARNLAKETGFPLQYFPLHKRAKTKRPGNNPLSRAH
ncbi:CHC2 zinc finger domain-containing protein [Pelagicoccus enzymogenes]|uniref:CHC2 zinc finger domain-containing protein n=1 Tax=Pelagicoccus enzymogenes TaxID=2773457 RepID=UPI00280E73FE|nr:CHC2 zinc finger domain-containing protein [Pelagicoccus enzymogenes]MDQ8199687.1 CHC2 zinc finger domain-containing protein [Pelagicoccus enzymogenes]